MIGCVQISTSVPPTPRAVNTTVLTLLAALTAVVTMATNSTVTGVLAQVCALMRVGE